MDDSPLVNHDDAESEEKVRCLACRLAILRDASRCPHCHAPQVKRAWDQVGSASTFLAILVGLTSLATFSFIGIPQIGKQVTRNKAILTATISGASIDRSGDKYYDVAFVNYGLQNAVVLKQYRCISHGISGKILVDKDDDPYIELFETQSENTTIEAESAKIIRFRSLGGLPPPIEELSYESCTLYFADLSFKPNSRDSPNLTPIELRISYQ